MLHLWRLFPRRRQQNKTPHSVALCTLDGVYPNVGTDKGVLEHADSILLGDLHQRPRVSSIGTRTKFRYRTVAGVDSTHKNN
jgi:hypothetical protein